MSTQDFNAKDTPEDTRWTVIQRDHYGSEVNVITGLDELSANNVAAILQTGSAYTVEHKQPWECEIVRELSPAEQAAENANDWLTNKHVVYSSSGAQIAAALELVASRVREVGDLPAELWMQLNLQVSDASKPEMRATVDMLTEALGAEVGYRGTTYRTMNTNQISLYAPDAAEEEPEAREDVPVVEIKHLATPPAELRAATA